MYRSSCFGMIVSVLIVALMMSSVILVSCGKTETPEKPDDDTKPLFMEGTIMDTTAKDETTASDAPATGTAVTDAPTVTDKPDNGEVRISFFAAGDNIIHENVFLDARSRAGAGQEYNFMDMYDGVAEYIKSADLAFINQETPICGDELGVTGYPNFNSPEAVGDTLIELGFDIVNIATNHMLDKGERGYRGALDYWDTKKEVTMIGGYRNKADYENIRIVEEQGVSIAFISYTYDTNKMYLPAGSEMYVPYIDEAEIVRMTKKADELADLVFVVMHWGGENENSHVPSNSQKSLARAITEAGADVILGGHPHVIQPMEWVKASDGSDTLVIYSLGNFISTQYDNRNLVGGIATFDIVKNKNGNITIENPVYTPTVTHYNKNRLGLQIYRMEDYTEELVTLHGNPNFGTTADRRIWTLDRIRGFAKNNVSPEFLPDFLK